jgi:hypothetical protein
MTGSDQYAWRDEESCTKRGIAGSIVNQEHACALAGFYEVLFIRFE